MGAEKGIHSSTTLSTAQRRALRKHMVCRVEERENLIVGWKEMRTEPSRASVLVSRGPQITSNSATATSPRQVDLLAPRDRAGVWNWGEWLLPRVAVS